MKIRGNGACLFAALPVGCIALLALGQSAAHAQVLSLSPSMQTTSTNSIVTYDVLLTDANDDAGYDFNIDLSSPDLTFVIPDGSTVPFAVNPSSPFTVTAGPDAISATDPQQFEAAFATGFGGATVTSSTPIDLGSFEVQTDGMATTVPDTISFGTPIGTSAGFQGGSEVDDSTYTNNLQSTDSATLTVTANASAAPEPSQIGMLALMGLGLGGLLFRAKQRKARSAR